MSGDMSHFLIEVLIPQRQSGKNSFDLCFSILWHPLTYFSNESICQCSVSRHCSMSEMQTFKNIVSSLQKMKRKIEFTNTEAWKNDTISTASTAKELSHLRFVCPAQISRNLYNRGSFPIIVNTSRAIFDFVFYFQYLQKFGSEVWHRMNIQ